MSNRKITVAGWPAQIDAGRGTVLDAALEAGVPAPHQCRAGECGECKCQVTAGKVSSAPYLPEALSSAEAAEGWILACRARPVTDDLAVRFPAPLRAPLPRVQKVAAQVTAIDMACRDVIRLELACAAPLDFQAGQYVSLRFRDMPERSFSPASLPSGRELEFFIKRYPGGLVSGGLLDSVAPGDTVQVHGPFGTACLGAAPSGPVLLAAGGTGLAPILSILRELSRIAPETPTRLYAGARSPADMFETATLDGLARAMPNLDWQWVLSDGAAQGRRGGLIGPCLTEDLTDLTGWDTYVAGPPPLVDSVTEAARGLGAAPERIFSDPFTAAPQGDAGGTRPGFLRRVLRTALGT